MQFEWDYPDPHSLDIEVAAAHIDGLNHTNNAVYVQWCEQVAWQHSNRLGLDLECYQRLDHAMVIARSEFHYLQAAVEGDPLRVGTWIVDWDQRLTMQRAFQIINRNSGDTVLRGSMNFVCVALSSGKPRRLPEQFIAGYGPAVLGAQ